MGQHYVPQTYLSGFCEPGGQDTLWLYDKRLRRFSRASVGSVAQERGFYSPPAGSEFERLVERPGNAVLDKLRRGGAIDDADRAHLAAYVATMLGRLPRRRQQVMRGFPEALADTVRELKDAISRAAAAGATDPSAGARRLA